MSLFTALHRLPCVPARVSHVGALTALTLSLLVRNAAAQETAPPPAVPPATPPPATAPPATATPVTTEVVPPLPPGTTSEKPNSHISYGPEVGVYFPSNGKTSRAFGSAWINYGLGIGSIHRATIGGQYQFDIGLFGTSRSEHQVYMAPIGLSYRRALNKSESSSPYVGLSLDLFLTQIRSDPDGIVSRIRGTEGGSVFIGETFHQAAYVQARYLLLNEIRGYNLSGLNIALGYRF